MLDDGFKLTTLENIPNSDLETHFGLVSGSAILRSGFISSFKTKIQTFFGGEVQSLDTTFANTRELAVKEMVESAKKLGANGVIGIRFESLRLANGYCEVHVYGSAVKINLF
ncbi:MAG: YbjQ family protein [Alphaproteobacteria bacterium]|jgi:uncharacterized protein YbjQ (UPF0145 family)|nr:YbjQ family protein [Candidatus Jidaibacter sp.]